VDYRFDPRKDALLRATRGRGFVEIIALIEAGHLLDVVAHPNQMRYPGQEIALVDVEGYVYQVPFLQVDPTTRDLRTIYASRKATRDHRKGRTRWGRDEA
jgi:hypothetical protein